MPAACSRAGLSMKLKMYPNHWLKPLSNTMPGSPAGFGWTKPAPWSKTPPSVESVEAWSVAVVIRADLIIIGDQVLCFW